MTASQPITPDVNDPGLQAWTAGSERFRVRRVRVLRRWMLALGVLAALPFVGVSLLAYRYHLDLGSAVAKALRSTARFTIDPELLQVAGYARVLWLGHLENHRADEVSGLAFSRRRDDLLWAVNDSGGGPLLYAIGSNGSDRGSVRVRGAVNVDWEALDSFVLDGQPYLLIADVGDNLCWRPAVTFYVVPEPELRATRFDASTEIEPAFVLRARLPDGPEDIEAVAFDARARRILMLTKRTVPPVLYALDFAPRHDAPTEVEEVLVARRWTSVPGIPQPTAADLVTDPDYGDGGSRPTAMDVSADGARAVVFTYNDAYVFERSPGEGWAQTFARPPLRVHAPRVRAMEAGAFGPDGRTLYMSSEFLPAPLYRFDPRH